MLVREGSPGLVLRRVSASGAAGRRSSLLLELDASTQMAWRGAAGLQRSSEVWPPQRLAGHWVGRLWRMDVRGRGYRSQCNSETLRSGRQAYGRRRRRTTPSCRRLHGRWSGPVLLLCFLRACSLSGF